MAVRIHLVEGAETGGLERANFTGPGWATSTLVRSGAPGAYCFRNSTNAGASLRFNSFEWEGTSQGTGIIAGVWWYSSGITAGDDLFHVDGTSNALQLGVSGSDTTAITVRDAVGSLRDTTATGVLQSATWHFIEIYLEFTTSGNFELFVDGTSVASGTGNFSQFGGDPVQLQFWHDTATADVRVDDFYLMTGATAATDRLGGCEQWVNVGDASSTISGDTPDVGTWPDAQEIPVSDTNYIEYTRDDYYTTERIAPDAILTQTNLTGSLTDIDDDPDSPDGLWMTASGKSVLRTSFPDGGETNVKFLTGTDQQQFKVLLRKSDTDAPGGTQRLAPDTIAVQTNLTGSVADIDDDPDSPDANWLTASGSSTLRTTFATPTNTPETGAGLQEFRVLMRKNATGPAAGTASETLYPDGTVFSAFGFSSPNVSQIDGAEDGTWLTSDGENTQTLRVSLPTPTGDLVTGAGLQTFRVYAKKSGSGGGTPTITIGVRETGDAADLATGTATDVTSDTGEVFTFTWDASLLNDGIDGNAVEVYITAAKGGGGGNERNVWIDSVSWINEYSSGGSETQPGYAIQVYENGSRVGTAEATGTLTDAGGDTVVSLTWDATDLGTADGSLVECYVNQTSGADRYIEIGAVEWNSDYAGDVEDVNYKLSLWEDGVEVSGVNTTGTLTDAGGDTVVSLSWDETAVANNIGVNVEVQIEQTDASPTKYMEVGAVEWNAYILYLNTNRSTTIDADSGSGAGPSGMSDLQTIINGTYFFRHKRQNTGGTYGYKFHFGNDVDDTTLLYTATGLELDNTWYQRTVSKSSGDANFSFVPETTQYSRIGFETTGPTKWNDAVAGEVIPMFAHVPASGGAHTLTVDPKAFTLGTPTVNLTRDLVLDVDSKGFTLGTPTVNLTTINNYTLTVDSKGFILGTPTVNLTRDLVLDVDSKGFILGTPTVNLTTINNYTLTVDSKGFILGTPTVNLTAIGSYTLDIDPKAFTLGTPTVNLTRDYVLGIDVQTFTLGTPTVNLTRDLVFTIDNKPFIFTTPSVTLTTIGNYILGVDPKAFSLGTPNVDLTPEFHYSLSIDNKAFTFDTPTVNLSTGFVVSVDSKGFTLGTPTVNLTRDARLEIDTKPFVFETPNVNLTAIGNYILNVDPKAFSLGTPNVNLPKDLILNIDTKAFTLGTPNVELTRDLVLDVDPKGFTLNTPTVNLTAIGSYTLNVDVKSFTLGTPTVNLNATNFYTLNVTPKAFTLDVPEINLTTRALSITSKDFVFEGSAALNYSGVPPTCQVMNFKRDAQVFIVHEVSPGVFYKYEINFSELNTGQTIQEHSYSAKTLQDQYMFEQSVINKANPATFDITFPAIREADFKVLFDRALDIDVFDLYIRTNKEVFKIRNCVITNADFIVEKLRPLSMTVSGQASQLSTAAWDSYIPGIVQSRSSSMTYNRISDLEMTLEISTILSDYVSSVNIELQNNIKWTPWTTVDGAVGEDTMYPESFTTSNRILAGSIVQYITDETDSTVMQWSTDSELRIKAGQVVGSTFYGFDLNLENCSFTNRINTSEIFTQSFDWRLTQNPTNLSDIVTYETQA